MAQLRAIEDLGAHAIERFGAERATIDAFLSELRRTAQDAPDELTPLLLRFEDYLEALLFETPRR